MRRLKQCLEVFCFSFGTIDYIVLSSAPACATRVLVRASARGVRVMCVRVHVSVCTREQGSA